MANKENTNIPFSSNNWYRKPTATLSEVRFQIHGEQYCLDRKLLTAKSGKFAALLKNHNNEELAHTFKNIPGDSTTFELAMKFCYGREVNLTAVNVVPLICLAFYLDMTEDHCKGNLINIALCFFYSKILPAWNEAVKAFQTTEPVFDEATRLSPRLLGEPFKKPTHSDEGVSNKNGDNRSNARKKLFAPNQRLSEALTSLSLRLYDLTISNMVKNGVQPEYIAASLYKYAKKWANVDITGEEAVKDCKEVIETIEKLLPDETEVLPCKLLFEMLQAAIVFHASPSCRYGFETRIGKQLKEATVEDLLIPSQGYASEMQFDTACVKRILKNFYANYNASDNVGMIKVGELIEDFLSTIARDVNLTKDSFISLSAVSVATSIETKRYSDGVYRAVNIYLDKHNYLTEAEKEEVCQGLDCSRLSPEACTHAAQNSLLPLRVVVQALFASQLHLRDVITTRAEDSDNGSRKEESIIVSDITDDARIEMEHRVVELENECDRMKKQIEGGVAKEKNSTWKALKRKLGCMSSSHAYNDCQVKKKVHPRNGA
ncbi:hypothetical protein MKW92_002246 [Papaver armeniacum]|nr:hypothetical protein MKW92_002246 [Papaver armeniacum]